VLKVMLAALAALLLAAPAAAAKRSQPALLLEMNRARAQYGLAPLTLDRNLERAATAHTRAMLVDGTFEHGAFAQRMVDYDVTGTIAGENLAWGTGARGTAQGIVIAWLGSPEHRANLLRPSFRRVGVGELAGPFRGYAGAHVVTADFAG
jgi:uncharacterized protein YkwD